MSNVWFQESFELYPSTTYLKTRYDSNHIGPSAEIATGRPGGSTQSLLLPRWDGVSDASLNFFLADIIGIAQEQQFTISFAMKWSSLPTSSKFFYVRSNNVDTNVGDPVIEDGMVTLRLNPLGQITFSSLCGDITSKSIIFPGMWHHLTVQVLYTPGNTTLSLGLWVDGVLIASPSPCVVDMPNFQWINDVLWHNDTTQCDLYLDDIYIVDIHELDFDYTGEVLTLVEDGVSQWTRSPITYTGVQCISEKVPDGDATFIATTVYGRTDTFGGLPLTRITNEVRSVKVLNFGRQDGSQSPNLSLSLCPGISGDLCTQGPNGVQGRQGNQTPQLNLQYQYYDWVWGSQASGGPWTPDAVQSTGYGVTSTP